MKKVEEAPQELAQRFYSGGVQWEKDREKRNEEKLFKKGNFPKLKTDDEWKEWQQHMARGIGKEIRLKNMYY